MPQRLSAFRGGAIARALALKRKALTGALKLNQSKESKILQEREEADNVREFLKLVESRIETRQGYLRLVALGTFFCIYSCTMIFQQRVPESFLVESR